MKSYHLQILAYDFYVWPFTVYKEPAVEKPQKKIVRGSWAMQAISSTIASRGRIPDKKRDAVTEPTAATCPKSFDKKRDNAVATTADKDDGVPRTTARAVEGPPCPTARAVMITPCEGPPRPTARAVARYEGSRTSRSRAATPITAKRTGTKRRGKTARYHGNV